MTPRELIYVWISRFNSADIDGLVELYHEDAINHQVAQEPVTGQEAIRAMFACEFATTDMHCIPEHVFEDGNWGILEWKDPLGLRGCGFFHVQEGKIIFQRGYWDKLSFLRLNKLPLPTE